MTSGWKRDATLISKEVIFADLKKIGRRILKAWSGLDKEIIIKSFLCCALSIEEDRCEGNKIACFKPGKPMSSGLEHLKTAMAESTKELVDPFTSKMIQT